jgi:hypothetical protein
MSAVQGFEYDIFISYSHIDDEPTIEGKPGWVDFFEDLLRKRLRVKLGGEVNIFRDTQLSKFGTFSDQLNKAISTSAVLVSIISPKYVQSKWCLIEMGEFLKQAGIDRIIKIVKTTYDNVELDDNAKSLLTQIKDVLEFRFYKKDPSSKLIKDLMPEIREDHVPECIDMVDELVQNLVIRFKNLRAANLPKQDSPSTVEASPPPPCPPETSAVAAAPGAANGASDQNQIIIYLAETTDDLEEERSRIKSELLQFDNYRVLPDKPLPQNAEKMILAVQDYLRQSKLSVHLIGGSYGTRLDEEERSIPHIQYELAAGMRKEAKLAQIVWMPHDLTPKEGSKHEQFVKLVKNSSPDYLQTNLEDLKTEIQKTLKPSAPDMWEDVEGEPINVCLFCHDQDENEESVRKLFTHLKWKESFKVKLPLKEAKTKEAGMLEMHKQILQSSDAVLLYYGSANDDWYGTLWGQIQNHSSAGGTKRILAQAIYVGHPETADKDMMLDSGDPLILKNYGEFTPDVLAPFIEKIRAAKGGAR